MADNIAVTAGSGHTVALDEVVDGTLGTVKVQYVKLMDGTLDGTGKVAADAANGLDVDVTRVSGNVTVIQGTAASLNATCTLAAGSATIGALTANQSVNVAQINGVTTTMGNGAAGTGVQRVTIASDSTGNIATIGTSVTPGTSAAHLGKAIDAVAGASDTGVATLAIRDDSLSALTPVEGDWTPLRVNSTGALHVTGGGGGTQYAVDDVAGATNTGTLALVVRDDALATLTPVDGDYTQLRTDSTGSLWVTPSSKVQVIGGDVHDAAITEANTPPVRIGAKAETSLSGITLCADGDATSLYAGVDGVLIVRKHANLEDVVQERTTNTDGASTAFASGLAAPGAGVRLWITNVDICNSSASFCTLDLRDGSAGSVLWTLPVPATGGVVKTFDPPIRLTANTALAFDASAATTTLTISVNGFKSKV